MLLIIVKILIFTRFLALKPLKMDANTANKITIKHTTCFKQKINK